MGSKVKGFLLVILGFILGFAFSIAVPAQAHCGQYTPWKHCWGHVKALQSISANLIVQVNDLSNRVDDLESKTGKLDTLGDYTGKVSGTQVNVPPLCGGSAAYWRFTGLSC